ncbi:hypothetical protein PORY_000253 [Pneumocystis oryctolagi]|uniref:Uncharacterized protein n=1 Tax=Pneumocystis oryctolagi TaxID=42067 RepID=A0ACB7CGH5_9ASCO|nr:hypothetical protein PORY_000253 [Pneumocystis oryctolagi]
MDSRSLNLGSLHDLSNENRYHKTSELFKTHLIRSLDILVYSHIVYIYFMDVSFLRLLVRSIVQLNIYAHKLIYFSFISPFMFFYAVFMSFFFCLTCHLLWMLPDAPDGQYGYLHGGIFINFVGEVHHCRLKSCFFDFIILFLQLYILNIKENTSDIILDNLLNSFDDEIE